jgi:hypothetical protein
MPMLVNLAPATPRRAEVWRHCETCDELVAMAPWASVCDACTAASPAMLGTDGRWPR